MPAYKVSSTAAMQQAKGTSSQSEEFFCLAKGTITSIC